MKATNAEKKKEQLKESLSRSTVAKYLPVIEAAIAGIEAEQGTIPQADKSTSLFMRFLEEEFGSVEVDHAMDVITVWLRGSKFSANVAWINKPNKETSWDELLQILHGKMLEFKNNAPVIVLCFSDSGRMTRIENGYTMQSDFAPDSQGAVMIELLVKHGGYISTREICDRIGCAGADALNIVKNRLNKNLGEDLQLPKTHKIIDSKRLSGYRINPIYNIVFVK